MRTLSRMYVSSGQSIFDSPSGVFSVTVNMHAAGARFTARAAGKAAGATRASALARNARAAANKTKKETVVKDRSRVVCRGEISRTGRGAGRHGRLRTDGFVQHLGSGEIDDGARRSHSAVVWSPCLRSFCRGAQAQPEVSDPRSSQKRSVPTSPGRSSAPAWAPHPPSSRAWRASSPSPARCASPPPPPSCPPRPPFAPTAARRWCARRRCRT